MARPQRRRAASPSRASPVACMASARDQGIHGAYIEWVGGGRYGLFPCGGHCPRAGEHPPMYLDTNTSLRGLPGGFEGADEPASTVGVPAGS